MQDEKISTILGGGQNNGEIGIAEGTERATKDQSFKSVAEYPQYSRKGLGRIDFICFSDQLNILLEEL